jgi:EAL domain-containing protein (putative c-di-GMP-specific phosphodiesterase class I)
VSYLERGRLVVQTVLRDISERVKAREELAEREQRFRDVVEAAGEYVWETDHEFSELLKNADAARYAAREADGNTYWFFSRELNTRALERLDMESALHRALARDEFVLHFQPVVHSAGATRPRLIGAEVLMRWRHPERGMLALGEFFPFAEQAGLMGALGGWLVERATGHIAAWGQGPAGGLWFALNVSAKELSRDRRFSDTLRGALHRNRLDGSRLALEISERSMQTGWDACTEALNAVAALGVALTIDDFGAGQSSLAALREMPVRKLKIDRSLVADLVAREDAGVIVQTVAAMAKGLGLSVAAEGVETEAQLARLRAAGCDEWQGRLYSEPLDADAFEALVSGVSRAASA